MGLPLGNIRSSRLVNVLGPMEDDDDFIILVFEPKNVTNRKFSPTEERSTAKFLSSRISEMQPCTVVSSEYIFINDRIILYLTSSAKTNEKISLLIFNGISSIASFLLLYSFSNPKRNMCLIVS